MIKNKERVNFSVDRETTKKFREVCEIKSVNMSKLIQKMIEKFIQENNID
jgi:hypothetical protein